MQRLLWIVLILGTGLGVARGHTPVRGHLGHDLRLPIPCVNPNNRFDLYNGAGLIGSYDGKLQGLRGYNGRLGYDSCAVTLRSLTEQDGIMFRVKFYWTEDQRLKSNDTSFLVNITDPVTFAPHRTPEKNQTTAGFSHLLGFVSFCFSVDSIVVALVTLRVLTASAPAVQRLVQRVKLRPCLASVVENCKKVMRDGGHMTWQLGVAILWQICSIGTMWAARSSIPWHLLPFPIIPPAALLMSYLLSCHRVSGFMKTYCCRSRSDDNKKAARIAWSVVMLILQILFPVLVGILYYRRDDGISRHGSPGIGYVFLAAFLSIVLRIVVFLIFYWAQINKKEISIKDPSEGKELMQVKTSAPPESSGNETLKGDKGEQMTPETIDNVKP